MQSHRGSSLQNVMWILDRNENWRKHKTHTQKSHFLRFFPPIQVRSTAYLGYPPSIQPSLFFYFRRARAYSCELKNLRSLLYKRKSLCFDHPFPSVYFCQPYSKDFGRVDSTPCVMWICNWDNMRNIIWTVCVMFFKISVGLNKHDLALKKKIVFLFSSKKKCGLNYCSFWRKRNITTVRPPFHVLLMCSML